MIFFTELRLEYFVIMNYTIWQVHIHYYYLNLLDRQTVSRSNAVRDASRDLAQKKYNHDNT